MRLISTLVLLTALTQPIFAQVTFQDVPNLPFLDDQFYLNGISWVDVDNDYDLDVCVTGMLPAGFVNESAIFINDGSGNFSNTGLIQSNQKLPFQHAWADIDNDNDLDLYIPASWEQNGVNELWKNNAGTSFSLTQNSGSTPNIPQPYQGTPGWADYDNDGWVDLFLPRWNNQSNRLYHNTGNGNFVEVTTGTLVSDLAWTTGGYWGDYDNDNDLDLFVVNFEAGLAGAPSTNDLFRNDGNGVFSKITTAGNIITQPERGRSANWLDANNDGRLDLFVCNQAFGPTPGQDLLHLNNGNGTFTTKTVGNTGHTSWSANWGDFDNDGDQDAVVLGLFGSDYRFWQNDGQGNLTDISSNFSNLSIGTSGSMSNAAVWVDADLDGWLDLHITQPDAVADHFYKNGGDPCKSWLEVKCVGQQSNHAAIGATIRAKASVNGNPVWQMRQVVSNTAATGNNPLWQHFGFADANIIDSLVVKWPSGKVCVFTQVDVNQVLEIKEDCSVFVIKASPPPAVSTFSAQPLCLPEPDPLTLAPTAPAGGTWVSDCNCVSQAGVFDPAGLATGEYLVRYLQGSTCELFIDTFLMTIYPQPEIELMGKDTVDFGEKVDLSAQGALTFLWEPAGALSCMDCDDPVFTADTTTIFTVIGSDIHQCTDTATIQVNVRDQLKVQMPNAFTPNGDQSNDVFRPAFKGNIFIDYHLTIYSRWGERVFETFTPGDGWDGRINELAASSDVYLYMFEYELKNGEKEQIPGEVTLLR